MSVPVILFFSSGRCHFVHGPILRGSATNRSKREGLSSMKFAHFSHVWAKPGMTPQQRYEELWRELKVCDEVGFDHAF